MPDGAQALQPCWLTLACRKLKALMKRPSQRIFTATEAKNGADRGFGDM